MKKTDAYIEMWLLWREIASQMKGEGYGKGWSFPKTLLHTMNMSESSSWRELMLCKLSSRGFSDENNNHVHGRLNILASNSKAVVDARVESWV